MLWLRLTLHYEPALPVFWTFARSVLDAFSQPRVPYTRCGHAQEHAEASPSRGEPSLIEGPLGLEIPLSACECRENIVALAEGVCGWRLMMAPAPGDCPRTDLCECTPAQRECLDRDRLPDVLVLSLDRPPSDNTSDNTVRPSSVRCPRVLDGAEVERLTQVR